MGRGQRLGLIVVALAVAVVAFIALRPGDDEDDGSTTSSQTTSVQSSTTSGELTTTEEPPPPPEPEVHKVVIKGGEVQGGEQRITVKKGDTARIDVVADISDELHLHGYDVYKDVAPGKPAKFRTKADAEGIFELEAHDLGHVIIAKLVVEP